MGIPGLLPTLKSIIAPVHVRAYAGKKAAVDTYSWLHKAVYFCAKDLCEGRQPDKPIEYCMHRVNLLRHHGVQPVLVFDGGVLPMKADQEAKRARSRNEHLERAREHEHLGNHAAANECYQRAVDITPTLAAKLIKVLQEQGVQYVVAPYEADAQMAYLAFHGLVDVVITEDSDLIAYGCPRVLFKMDRMGNGDEFQFSDLVRNRDLNFSNFTKQMVLEMCVMSGCDYLPSLSGMGVKKAHGLIRRFKCYKKVIRHLRSSGVTIAAQYEELFEKALLTFRHQRVYDPVHQAMVHLTDVPDDVTVALEFVGPDLPQKLIKAIAEGEVDPITRLPFQTEAVVSTAKAVIVSPVPRFGDRIFGSRNGRKGLELPAQKNVLTNYFFSESQEAKKQFRAPRFAPRPEEEVRIPVWKNPNSLTPPETANLSNVFGSPLPVDDSDDDDNDDHEGSSPKGNGSSIDYMPRAESQESIGRKGGVLQDNTSESASASTGKFSVMERRNIDVDGPQVKVSSYFLDQSKLGKPHATDIPSGSVSETAHRNADKEEDSGDDRGVKKSKVGSHEPVAIFPTLKADAVNSRSRVFSSEVACHKVQRSAEEEEFCEVEGGGENCTGNQLPCTLRTTSSRDSSGGSQLKNFASNVTHVDQFAQIAKKSIDRFVETITPFRCSSGKGARASGLRAPLKSTSTNTSKGPAGNGQQPLTATLKQFSYQSSFKPPALDLAYSRPRFVTADSIRSPDPKFSNYWS